MNYNLLWYVWTIWIWGLLVYCFHDENTAALPHLIWWPLLIFAMLIVATYLHREMLFNKGMNMFKRKETNVKKIETMALLQDAPAPEAVTPSPPLEPMEKETFTAPLSQPADSTTIPANCIITGEISAAGDIHVNGTVEGKVHSEKTIFLLTEGKVEGEVNADKIVINGVLTGLCSGREVEINAKGLLDGTLECDTLSINKQGRFYGISRPLSQEVKKEEETKKPVERLSTGSLTRVPDSFMMYKTPPTTQEN